MCFVEIFTQLLLVKYNRRHRGAITYRLTLEASRKFCNRVILKKYWVSVSSDNIKFILSCFQNLNQNTRRNYSFIIIIVKTFVRLNFNIHLEIYFKSICLRNFRFYKKHSTLMFIECFRKRDLSWIHFAGIKTMPPRNFVKNGFLMNIIFMNE